MPILPVSTIDVHIALDAVVIDGHDGPRDTYQPIVHIRPPKPGTTVALTAFPIPVAIGTEHPSEAAVAVALFSPTHGSLGGYLKVACLGAFFRLAFKRVMDRHLLRTRPVIRVHGTSALSSALCGYEESLLFEALGYAGAREVHFTA